MHGNFHFWFHAAQVYDTQRQLERESQLLRAELAAFKQQLRGWSTSTQQLLEGLKHTGDLEHYVAVLSREAAALAKVMTPAAAAETQTEAAATALKAEESRTAVSDTQPGTAAADGLQGSAAGAAAAVAGSEQGASVAQCSTAKQPTASAELPVSKRASR